MPSQALDAEKALLCQGAVLRAISNWNALIIAVKTRRAKKETRHALEDVSKVMVF